MAKLNFEPPMIFGALCDDEPSSPRGIERAIRSRVAGAVLLPFQVEARHLKNVIDCMKLMDVMGLVVLGAHRKKIAGHVPKLDRSAKAAGRVDVIARRGRGFVGLLRGRDRPLGMAQSGQKNAS